MAFVFAANSLVTPALAEAIYGDPSAVDGNGVLIISPAKKLLIEMSINAASTQIQRYCDRSFAAADYVEVQDGVVNDEILTKQYPILAVTEINFSLGANFANGTSLPPEEYGTDGNTIVLRFARTVRGRRSVQIKYRAGYEEVPADLAFACISQAKYGESRLPMGGKTPALFGIQSMSKGDESITRDSNIGKTGFLSDVLGVIDGYRRVEAPASTMFPRFDV